MAFCNSCGVQIDSATFCPKCGAAQNVSTSAPVSVTTTPTNAPSTAGLSENVAGLLCYVLGWVTGLIFLLIDKRPFVKFHAAQSIVVFGGLNLITIVLGMFLGLSVMSGGFHLFGGGYLLLSLIHLVAFVLWILLMVKAYQHEKFRLPIVAELAENIFGKS